MRSGNYVTREIRKAPASKKTAARKASAANVTKKAGQKHKPARAGR